MLCRLSGLYLYKQFVPAPSIMITDVSLKC
jgi:hypothetical protein